MKLLHKTEETEQYEREEDATFTPPRVKTSDGETEVVDDADSFETYNGKLHCKKAADFRISSYSDRIRTKERTVKTYNMDHVVNYEPDEQIEKTYIFTIKKTTRVARLFGVIPVSGNTTKEIIDTENK